MFVRNGEKLGSVLHDADPGNAGPKRARKSAAKAELKSDDDEKSAPDEKPEPEAEPESESDPKKAAPAKKTAFKSALDKKD